jgi:rubrerythrin
MLMAGFMSKNGETKRKLTDFSDILFRHFTWIENDMIRNGIDYDYDRGPVPIKVERLSHMLRAIVSHLNTIENRLDALSDKALAKRIASDIAYMKTMLERTEDETITAFSMSRTLPNVTLSQEATDALTLFLFEESYKEYELILVYNYLKAHSDDAFLNRIFQIMIDESFFHLKSFGELMAKMGILGVPRTVMKELYKVENIVTFLENGIEEEVAAKEECKKLAEAVVKESPQLAAFFDFINYQEDYHIELMKEALAHYGAKVADA